MYKVIFAKTAQLHMDMHVRAGSKQILRKIEGFLEELQQHPRSGTGKPEPLRYALHGEYSRRINKEHRLVYAINETTKIVEVLSAKGHYR